MIELDGEGWTVVDALIGSKALTRVKQISMQIRWVTVARAVRQECRLFYGEENEVYRHYATLVEQLRSTGFHLCHRRRMQHSGMRRMLGELEAHECDDHNCLEVSWCNRRFFT